MTRSRIPAFAVALLFLPSAVAAPVPAGSKAKDVSELPVAADAMAVVQLNGVDRTKGRVAKMLEGIDPPLAKKVGEQLDEVVKEALDGRDLKGIDPNGRVFVAVGDFGELAGDTPPVVVAVPVKDYKTFKEKFLTEGERKGIAAAGGGIEQFDAEPAGKTMFAVDTKGGYVVLTPSKETAEKYADKLETLSAKKLGAVGESFLDADLAVFLNLERINQVYGEQIKQGKAFIALAMQQGGAGFDPKQMQVARTLFDGLFQVVEDATGLVIAVEARPEGANLRFDAAFKPDTPTARTLAAEKPNPLKALADLPKGMKTYTASKWGKAFTDLQRSFGGEFAAPDGDEKLAERLVQWADLLASAEGETVTVSGPESASLTVTAFKDAGKVTAAKLKLMKELPGGSTYSNLVLKQQPTVKESAQKHGGLTLHAANIEVDYEASVKNVADATAKEAAVEAMKKLVPEKQTVFFGADGGKFVQVTAKDWAAAKALLDTYADPKAKAGGDPAFALTRKQLPAEAGFVTLVDTVETLNGMAESFGAMAGAIPAPGLEVPKLPGKIKGETSYVGVAFTARPGNARFDLFVPAAAIKTVRKAIEESEKE